jgi:hypothetical protein
VWLAILAFVVLMFAFLFLFMLVKLYDLFHELYFRVRIIERHVGLVPPSDGKEKNG